MKLFMHTRILITKLKLEENNSRKVCREIKEEEHEKCSQQRLFESRNSFQATIRRLSHMTMSSNRLENTYDVFANSDYFFLVHVVLSSHFRKKKLKYTHGRNDTEKKKLCERNPIESESSS